MLSTYENVTLLLSQVRQPKPEVHRSVLLLKIQPLVLNCPCASFLGLVIDVLNIGQRKRFWKVSDSDSMGGLNACI